MHLCVFLLCGQRCYPPALVTCYQSGKWVKNTLTKLDGIFICGQYAKKICYCHQDQECKQFPGILLFASVLYYVERIENPDNFKSIPHSLWYTCVTMMTTGYGDVVPLTTLGKIIGGLCCICGVVIMSLPIPIMQDKKVIVRR